MKTVTREPLRFSRNYSYYPVSDDRVVLRRGTWSSDAVELVDKKERKLLSKTLREIDGKQTLSQIAARFDVPVAQITDLLAPILRNGLIEHGITEARDSSLVERYYGEFGNKPGDISSKLSSKRVAVLGCQALGSRITFQLSQIGCNLEVVDDALVASSDLMEDPFISRMELGANRAYALAKVLKKMGRNNVEGNSSKWTDWISTKMKSFDLVVLAFDSPIPEAYTLTNEKANQHKIVWSIVTSAGTEGMVGPTFVPGETPCYQCFQTRLESNLGLPIGDDSKKHAIEVRYNGEFCGLGSHADLLSSIFSSDAPDTLLHRAGSLAGRMIVVDLVGLTMETNYLLKIPRCRACGRLSKDDSNRQLFMTYRRLLELRAN